MGPAITIAQPQRRCRVDIRRPQRRLDQQPFACTHVLVVQGFMGMIVGGRC